MSARARICALALCAVTLLTCSQPEHPLHGVARGKDVVVVVIDTLRADALPMYGYPLDTAPTMAGLAAEGALFEHALASSSWTAPSTASLFTSQHPDQHGVLSGYQAYKSAHAKDAGARLNRIPALLETLPELFQRQGYQTLGVADNPNICERMGFTRGFDRFHNTSEQSESYATAPEVNRVVRAWWQGERDPSKPAFVYVHYMDPHAPYHQREPWYVAPEGGDEVALDRAAYDSEIRFVDTHLAELLEILEVGPETLVLVTSDHGEEFGEHGGRYHGFQLHAELTHIPLIVRAPGLGIAPRRVAGEVGLIDVLPTLRDLLGAPASDQDEGASMLALLAGEPGDGRPVFAMRTREPEPLQHKHAVVRAGWKYILSRPGDEEQLFDLGSDPREANNLLDSQGPRAQELRKLLEGLERLPRPMRAFSDPAEMSEAQRRRFNLLGYTNGERPKDE